MIIMNMDNTHMIKLYIHNALRLFFDRTNRYFHKLNTASLFVITMTFLCFVPITVTINTRT